MRVRTARTLARPTHTIGGQTAGHIVLRQPWELPQVLGGRENTIFFEGMPHVSSSSSCDIVSPACASCHAASLTALIKHSESIPCYPTVLRYLGSV